MAWRPYARKPIRSPARWSAIVENLQGVDGDSCRWPRPAATRGWCEPGGPAQRTRSPLSCRKNSCRTATPCFPAVLRGAQ